jgi:hypothetical protein
MSVVAQLAEDLLAFDLQAHQQEEQRHQAVVDALVRSQAQ